MTSESLLSDRWHRVARIRPRLRRQCTIHRQVFRGVPWYVTQDPVTGRFHRFNAAAYRVIGLMDGQRTMEEIWTTATTVLGDEVPTQDEIIQLLSALYRADLLETDRLPDIVEMVEREAKQRRKERLQSFKMPLSIRIPLFDPDGLLDIMLPYFRPLFTIPGFVAWMVAVIVAVVVALAHGDELSGDVIDRLLAGGNVLLLTLSFIVVKACHEFGHGLAVKRWGGEVHEMGIMLLVLFPVPYVDASASAAFPERHRRMIVGAAGIMVEWLLAVLALAIWLHAEPGTTVRAIAYDVLFVAGVSTLVFNGNPLLRFDGYYILSDLIGIPNLGQRSNQYLGYLIQRYLFRVDSARSSSSGATGEAAWFVFYAIASFIYRFFVMLGIALLIAGKYFTIGLLLAAWSIHQSILAPLFRQVRFLFTSPVLRRRRRLAFTVSFVTIICLVSLVLFVPAPFSVRSQGVVWVPENAWVRAGIDCRIAAVLVEADSRVETGQGLFRCRDASLQSEAAVITAQLRELRARKDTASVNDRVLARLADREIENLLARKQDISHRLALQTIRSPVQGRFVVEQAGDLVGRFVHQAERLAYVLPDQKYLSVRTVVPLDEAPTVRSSGRIEARLAESLGRVLEARMEREIPEASDMLPSPALAVEGGGTIVVRAGSENAQDLLHTVEPHFQFELRLPHLGGSPVMIGERVYLLFHGPDIPLAVQVYRQIRVVLLRHLGF